MERLRQTLRNPGNDSDDDDNQSEPQRTNAIKQAKSITIGLMLFCSRHKSYEQSMVGVHDNYKSQNQQKKI